MNIFVLPASMIVVGGALYAWGNMKRDPLRIYLVSPRGLIVLGGALLIFGLSILAVFYFKGL